MRGTIEISMYPLDESYVGPIRQFIERLHEHDGVEVETCATSTRVSGDYDHVMTVVNAEMRRVHAAAEATVVFVLKVLCAPSPD